MITKHVPFRGLSWRPAASPAPLHFPRIRTQVLLTAPGPRLNAPSAPASPLWWAGGALSGVPSRASGSVSGTGGITGLHRHHPSREGPTSHITHHTTTRGASQLRFGLRRGSKDLRRRRASLSFSLSFSLSRSLSSAHDAPERHRRRHHVVITSSASHDQYMMRQSDTVIITTSSSRHQQHMNQYTMRQSDTVATTTSSSRRHPHMLST